MKRKDKVTTIHPPANLKSRLIKKLQRMTDRMRLRRRPTSPTPTGKERNKLGI